ncbi:MAG: FAD-dependent oxidoreductase [Planctomycetota bacterium]
MMKHDPQRMKAVCNLAGTVFVILMTAEALWAQSTVSSIAERGKHMPIAYDVDVVVVGGSSAGVAAACEARKKGASVFLISDRPYVGVDMCAHQRLWLEPGEEPSSELGRAVFGKSSTTTPLAVKRAMDEALLKAGVPYLTGCYATELLSDGDGNVAGIVMANRSGRQAVRAKVVIDGSRHAVLARQTRAVFREFRPGEKAFRFIVVGGEMQQGNNLLGRQLDVTYDSPTSRRGPAVKYPVYEYTVSVHMKDASPASFAAAEQKVRNAVSGSGMKDCSEVLYFLPEDTVIGESRIEGTWPGADRCGISAFRPRGLSRFYVLSTYADVDKATAEGMFRPLEFMAIGRRIGQEAATVAKQLPSPGRVRLSGVPVLPASAGLVRENLSGLRASRRLGTINADPRPLPVFGQCDVVVVGGGTAGAPAGISAARRGSKTLVIEYLDELGGVGTAGLIGSYWRGNRRGFTREIDEEIGARERWDVVAKSEWLRRELIRNGVDVWLCSFGCGAIVAGGAVRGVVVATPQGRGVVLAKTVIDATGNSDIAFCAGAKTQFSVSTLGVLSVQLAGFPHRNLGDNYNNTCYTMVDDTDVVDVWHLMASMRMAYSGRQAPYDLGQLVDSRERRRIIGEYTLSTQDILNQRTHPDTISQHKSNFDAGAFPDSAMLLIYDMKGPDFHVDMPYRCLLPRGLDGILVTGLGASAERDAMTLVRMQPDLQNQGYAAGMAAALAARLDGCTRRIDIKEVQRQMVEEGVLEPRVISDKDSYPMDESVIASAVVDMKQLGGQHDQTRSVASRSMKALAVIMAHPKRSIPLLREAYEKASTEDERINYAKILAILGDKTGVPTLIAAVDAQIEWDKGYPYTAGRKVGNVFSDLDRLIIALGYSGDPRALEPILRKAAVLEPETVLSHYKAVTLALRHLRNRSAIEPMAGLLKKPGLGGHAVTNPVGSDFGPTRLFTRRSFGQLNAAFKEIIVAATLYQCGDHDNVGYSTLRQYSQDVNGHFASFARAILEQKGLPK